MNANRICGLVALCVLLAGCGSGAKLGRVTGTVSVDGKPVTQGTIMFIPADGKAAVGSIGPDGHYTLTTFDDGDGALVGEHRVTILATTVGASSLAPATFEDEIALSTGKGGNRILIPGKVTWIVPERFSHPATTDLTATVNAGRQSIDFNLPSN